MIYLIDDNQADQRRVNYNLNFVDDNSYSTILKSIVKLQNHNDKGFLEHLTFLKDAECILIHTTTEGVDENGEFIKGATSNVTKITESISNFGEKIPLVLFSNGGDEYLIYDFRKSPNFVKQIKKNQFYSRLYDFLENYKVSGLIELRILAYGKDYLQYELEKSSERVLMNIMVKSDHDLLKISDISDVLVDFKDFINTAKLKYTADELLNEIEDNPMTIGRFKENINSINESYTKHGKNLHDWV